MKYYLAATWFLVGCSGPSFETARIATTGSPDPVEDSGPTAPPEVPDAGVPRGSGGGPETLPGADAGRGRAETGGSPPAAGGAVGTSGSSSGGSMSGTGGHPPPPSTGGMVGSGGLSGDAGPKECPSSGTTPGKLCDGKCTYATASHGCWVSPSCDPCPKPLGGYAQCGVDGNGGDCAMGCIVGVLSQDLSTGGWVCK